MKRNRMYVLPALALWTVSGCAGSGRSHYQTLPSGGKGNTEAAQRLNEQGLTLVEESEYEEAEQKFREALGHDIYCAAAHNNLGLVLLQTNRHYEAAWEFEYAAKLVPHAAEPRENLGLLYEAIGRLDKAVEQYESAVDVDPNSVRATRYLARVLVKSDRRDDRLRAALEKILIMKPDGQWDDWARGQLVRLGRTADER